MPKVVIKHTSIDECTHFITLQGRSRGRPDVENFVNGLIDSAVKSISSMQYVDKAYAENTPKIKY